MLEEVCEMVRVFEVVDAREDRTTVCFSAHSGLASTLMREVSKAAQRRSCACAIR
jgi:hypothetical protein